MNSAHSLLHAPIVSSEDEELILVDPDDRVIGYASKARSHDGQGTLHRAFSAFIFNARGELLLHQRASGKRLWPGYWTNSCCSHPRRGESIAEAAERRLEQELGLSCALTVVYKFKYRAQYSSAGAEHELCHVLVGQTANPVQPNPTEVQAWRFIAPEELDREMAACPERFTPWVKLEWKRLRGEFGATLPRPLQRSEKAD
jgi:isopentenyl-diphosphate delta-isomerase